MAVSVFARKSNIALFADISVLIVAVFWGGSYTAAKIALQYDDVLVFMLLRFALTAALMAPITLRGLRADLGNNLKIGIPLGTILFSIFIAETYGIKYTTASNAAVLISLCVVFTPLLDSLITRTRLDWRIVAAAMACVMGTGVLINGSEVDFNLGDQLILVAAGLRALMVTATKKLTTGHVLSSGGLTTVQLGTVAVLTLFTLMAMPGPLEFHISTDTPYVLAVLYLVVMCTMFAFYVQTKMVRATSPTRVSMLMGTEPIFGAVFAVMLLGETLTPSALIGGGVIVIATYVGIRIESQKASLTCCDQTLDVAIAPGDGSDAETEAEAEASSFRS